MMAQVLGFLTWTRHSNEVPDSWLWPGSVLADTAIWEDEPRWNSFLSLSVCLCLSKR